MRSVNVIRTLDIVRVPPLAMCGCGVIYHPLCPRGCGQLLQRVERLGHDHPLLSCSRCGYELSAEDVESSWGVELLRPPAKSCCQGPKSATRQPDHFVDREVVVMELVEHGLVDLPQLTRQDDGSHHRAEVRRRGHGERGGRLPTDRHEAQLAQKAMLAEKLHLMVQLADALAWLHGEKRIIRKDLAPDNVMVVAKSDTDGVSDWRGESQVSLREQLLQACGRRFRALRSRSSKLVWPTKMSCRAAGTKNRMSSRRRLSCRIPRRKRGGAKSVSRSRCRLCRGVPVAVPAGLGSSSVRCCRGIC